MVKPQTESIWHSIEVVGSCIISDETLLLILSSLSLIEDGCE